MRSRPLSLAHLTLIDVPPPALVTAAAEVGFDAVGLRITPVSQGPDHSMPPGSPMLRETVRCLDDTGLRVLDVEVVRLRPDTDPLGYDGFLDSAAALGARFVIVTGEDPVPARAAATFAALCGLATSRGITAMLEFMVFSHVRTLQEAVSLLHAAAAPNAGILVDALHLARSGGTPAEVATLPRELVPYVQICDSASSAPAVDAAVARDEARLSRLLCGEGALPLSDLVGALASSAALSLESPDGWHNPDPVGRARSVLRSVEPLLMSGQVSRAERVRRPPRGSDR